MVTVELLDESPTRSTASGSESTESRLFIEVEEESDEYLARATSSRQLEFADVAGENAEEEEKEEDGEEGQVVGNEQVGVNGGDAEDEEKEDETTEGTQESVYIPSEDNTETESEVDNEEEEEASSSPKQSAKKGKRDSDRRVTVFWTQEEVDFLRHGVRTRGIGHWKYILSEGAGVFNEHRTNVDLKDKWANLVKRHGEDELKSERPIEVDFRSIRKRKQAEVINGSPAKKPRARKQQRTAPAPSASGSEHSIELDYGNQPEAEDSVVEVSSESEIDTSEPVKVEIGTDYSFPDFKKVAINLTTCNTIEALKKRVRSKILPASKKDVALDQMEVVSIRTKRLLEDHEQLEHCLRKDGRKLYVVV